MLLFSPGGRQLINAAVDHLGDLSSKQIWQRWADANPRVRCAGDPWDDGGAPLPQEIVEIIRFALNEMAREMRNARDRAESEDDIADFDNDLSRVEAIIQLLTDGPPARAPMVIA
jgi:hypothetical protein